MCARSNPPEGLELAHRQVGALAGGRPRTPSPTNTRIGGLAVPPMTSSISSAVSAMFTNRRPSRPIVSSGHRAARAGADELRGRGASRTPPRPRPRRSPPCGTRPASPCTPPHPSSPSAARCPTGRPISSARGFTRRHQRRDAPGEQPLPGRRDQQCRRTRRAPIATDLPTATPGLSSRATPSASWVTPSSTILRAQAVVLPGGQPAPSGSATGTLRVHERCSPPSPSSSVSLPTMIAPARPPTAMPPAERCGPTPARSARPCDARAPAVPPLRGRWPPHRPPGRPPAGSSASAPYPARSPATFSATASIRDCDVRRQSVVQRRRRAR